MVNVEVFLGEHRTTKERKDRESIGERRLSQKTADFRRKAQKTTGTRRKPQIGVCPLSSSPQARSNHSSFVSTPRMWRLPRELPWRPYRQRFSYTVAGRGGKPEHA